MPVRLALENPLARVERWEGRGNYSGAHSGVQLGRNMRSLAGSALVLALLFAVPRAPGPIFVMPKQGYVCL
jgi:hypothetical protein